MTPVSAMEIPNVAAIAGKTGETIQLSAAEIKPARPNMKIKEELN